MKFVLTCTGQIRKRKEACLCILLALGCLQFLQAQPVITSFSPTAGIAGTEVTINGTNFSPVAANNIVYFGRLRATVNAATATSINVTVPLRSTDHFISVTTNQLTAYSAQPFTVVSGGTLSPSSYPVKWEVGVSGSYPSGLLIGDWNDDGKPDLLSANFNSNNLSLFQSNADNGIMQTKPEQIYASAKMPEGMAFGDVDGDGKPDLVVASIDDHLFSVFRNLSAAGGSIAFAPKLNFPAGDFNSAPRGVALGDLDGDGKPDLALAGNNKWYTANTVFGTLTIQRNTSQNGTISFANTLSLQTGEYPRKVWIADLDGDGKPDLVATNHVAGSVTVYKNTSVPGTMSFTARTDYPTGTNTEQLAIGDLNADGKPDLVVSNLVSSNVTVLKNTSSNGMISFSEKKDLFVTGPIGVALGDLSGDGKPDLVVASYSTGKIVVYPNNSVNGTISFAPRIDYACGSTPVEVSIGDLDGDGHPDIALTNASTNLISVLKRKPGEPSLDLGKDVQRCQGDSVLLSATLPNANFQWSTGAATNSITVKQSGSYWVKATIGGVTVADTVNVTFKPLPRFNLGGDTTLCSGETLLLQPNIPNATFTWQNGSTSKSLLVKSPGAYWLQLESDGCTAADTLNVSYKPLPKIPLGSDTSFCTGSTLLLDATDPSVESYTWQNGTHQPKITVQSPAVVWVQVKGWNGCLASDTIHIREMAAFTLGKDTSLCKGATLDYQFMLENAGFLWNDGSSQNHFSITRPGLYWLQATQAGCSHRDSVFVTFQSPPAVNLGSDTLLCEGTSKVLNAYSANATYLWNNGSTAAAVTVRGPGTYWVAVAQNGCTVRDTVQILYTPLPHVNLGPDTILCSGQNITLDPKPGNVGFLWQDGSTASSYTVTAPGRYRLSVTNNCGIATDDILVTEGFCTIAMPTAFTPNNDGKNDLFRVKHPAFIKTFRMEIFNRWGQLVFHSTDPYTGWNGKVNDLPAPPDNYVWTIRLTDKNNTKQFFRGNVVLIR